MNQDTTRSDEPQPIPFVEGGKSTEGPEPGPINEETEQDLYTRAKEVTNQELLTTVAYHRAIAAGNDDFARDLLFTGYLAEHYRALIGNRAPNDEELLRYRGLLDDFERLLRRLGDPPSPYP